MKFDLSKLPKSKQFEFKPRYYDEKKDRQKEKPLEERIKFKRGQRFADGNIELGNVRGAHYESYKEAQAQNRIIKMALLLAMLGCTLFGFMKSIWYMAPILILMVIFLRINNRH